MTTKIPPVIQELLDAKTWEPERWGAVQEQIPLHNRHTIIETLKAVLFLHDGYWLSLHDHFGEELEKVINELQELRK